LQDVHKLDAENFRKYNEYKETHFIDGKPHDVVTYKMTNEQQASAAENPEEAP